MRLLIVFTLIFATIAFVQSKPFLNQFNPQTNLPQEVANTLSPVQQQILAQTVLNGQINTNTAASQLINLRGSDLTHSAMSRNNPFNPFEGFFNQIGNAMNQFQNNLQQFANTFDPKKIEAASKVCFQLVESIVKGDVEAKVAADEFFLLLQQNFGSENVFLSAFIHGSQQLIHFVIEIMAQLGNAVNEIHNNVQHFTKTFTFEQLQSLGEVFSQLVQSVLSGKVEAKVAASELLLLIQQSFGTDNEYLNRFFNGAQEFIDFVSDKLTRPASRKLLLNNIQGVLPEFEDLAQQFANTLSPVQLQTLSQTVLNGQISANTAASQLLSQIQQYLGSKQ